MENTRHKTGVGTWVMGLPLDAEGHPVDRVSGHGLALLRLGGLAGGLAVGAVLLDDRLTCVGQLLAQERRAGGDRAISQVECSPKGCSPRGA